MCNLTLKDLERVRDVLEANAVRKPPMLYWRCGRKLYEQIVAEQVPVPVDLDESLPDWEYLPGIRYLGQPPKQGG